MAYEGGPGQSYSQGPKKFSCKLCYQRKVKCDRNDPCGYCSRRQDTCVYENPPPPKRRKRAHEGEDGPIRLSSRSNDILPTPTTPTTPSRTDTPSSFTASTSEHGKGNTVSDTIKEACNNKSASDGRLISDQGRTRYLDNNLWVLVDDELRNPDQILREGAPNNDLSPENHGPDSGAIDAGSMLFGTGTYSDEALAELYPTPKHSFILWQAYQENVHLLCHMIHPPSFQHVVEEAASNVRAISRSNLALLFSIHVFAVASMSNAECEKRLNQPRVKLLTRLKIGTRQALIKAAFVRSTDLTTLTAFLNFLLCMRHGFDAQTLWVLSGVAFRIAQRIGLHHDQASDSLSPFEIEMRRRLWRQLIILDHTSSELAGSAPTYSIMIGQSDAKLPLNVNDTDLSPTMSSFPTPHEGATDMIFCQLRYEFGSFFVQLTKPGLKAQQQQQQQAHHGGIDDSPFSMAKKDETINALEQTLQQKFLKYCDPLIPLHNLTAIAARAAICGMRLRAHHPRQYADGGASMSQSERDTLFTLSLKIMQYDTLVHATPSLHKFLWHVRVYFQWHALIYLLTEMRFRKVGPEAEKAWEQVEDVFQYHAEILNQDDYALYSAIRILTLRAWEARKAELQRLHLAVEMPPVILKMRDMGLEMKGPFPVRALENNLNMNHHVAVSNGLPSVAKDHTVAPQGFARSQLGEMGQGDGGGVGEGGKSVFQEPSPVDWEQWDELLRSMDLPDLNTSLETFFK
ncbi:hypothetical protein E6O75_ATG02096 [Venturia nashicola]|uniref:Zn(2)-C6 fungal-type domain-containing protein n=1 Tax=Venturia nashicola TaxID=86259 RepID=A0A4Z1PKM4_9PEZI|nr:hypothetical protein E6O75_ATG02096 [Venturia nashicola]